MLAQRGPVVDFDPGSRVLRIDDDSSIAARRDLAPCAEADGGVERLRAVVKEVERPDIEGAARKVDPRRGGSFDAHARDYTEAMQYDFRNVSP